MFDLIIIGGGPAGITAGIYAARKRLKILFLTKDFQGQVGKTGEIDNWPGDPMTSGLVLAKKFEDHLKKFDNIEISVGAEVTSIEKEKYGFKVSNQKGDTYSSRALIIATGRKPRLLNVPGEKEFTSRGVSYCSICDAPFFNGKKVVVIGGGNSGFESALDIAKYAKKVFIFEQQNKVRADEILQDQVKQAGIEVLVNQEITSIKGSQMVEQIDFKNLKTNETFTWDIGGVFIDIGFVPSVDLVKDLVKLNKLGEIKVDKETCQTSLEGVYGAGDNNDIKYRQIITAASEGAKAALSVYEFLHK